VIRWLQQRQQQQRQQQRRRQQLQQQQHDIAMAKRTSFVIPAFSWIFHRAGILALPNIMIGVGQRV
jgi:uncharacterized membrane protein (DUF106 family)